MQRPVSLVRQSGPLAAKIFGSPRKKWAARKGGSAGLGEGMMSKTPAGELPMGSGAKCRL